MAKNTRTRPKYTEIEKLNFVNQIIEDIYNNGKSTRDAIRDSESISVCNFYEIINSNEEILNNYARAKESAIEFLQDQAIEIAKTQIISEEVISWFDKDGVKANSQVKEYDNVNRSKLIVDAILQKSRTMASKNRKEQEKEDENTIQPILSNNPLADDTSDNSITED